MRTALVRLAAPSFPQIEATWDLTVWSLMSRRAAIALFGRPSARSSSTSISRRVKGSSSTSVTGPRSTFGVGATRKASAE